MKRLCFLATLTVLQQREAEAIRVLHPEHKLIQVDEEAAQTAPAAPQDPTKPQIGLTQFMKNYAKKFTDMVATTRQAAIRLAPLLRGEKAAQEMKNARALQNCYPSCPQQSNQGGCGGCSEFMGHFWPNSSCMHAFPFIAPPGRW